MNHKVILIVMDGWGEAPRGSSNAISCANTPFVDSLYRDYPHCRLLTSGENVGLPDGQMGNSEVGHLNLGAGRVVYQELALINKAIREKTIDENEVLNEAFNYSKKNEKDLHLIGLVSDGGVHSHLNHLSYLCKLAHRNGVQRIFIHAFTDGRDTDPHSGLHFINTLEKDIEGTGAKIASVVGRYYAMDRDKRWERVNEAYQLLVNGMGRPVKSASEALSQSYNDSVTDEFVKPASIRINDKPLAVIKNGDAVICFNFRTDRCREITQALTQQDFPDQGMSKLDLHYVTMTNYDKNYKNVDVIYQKDDLSETLGEVISKAGKTQLRISETEKYPHVTFFFSGGREVQFEGEERIMVPSPKVATYDLKPSMSAREVTDKLLTEINKSKFDFICLNYANADMVGHTGVFKAVVDAVETVDGCVKEVVEAALKNNYALIITADHGNADMMINPDGSPNTAHTTNPVPCFLVMPENSGLKIGDGRLSDVAPTILSLMGISIPVAMTGKNLVS